MPTELEPCVYCQTCYSVNIIVSYHGEQRYACPRCARLRTELCSVCGRRFDLDDLEESSGIWLCLICQPDYFVCQRCCNLTHNEDESASHAICQDCYDGPEEEEEEEAPCTLHGYHSGDCNIQFLPDGTHKLYFGVELETDKFDTRSDATKELYALSQNEDLFWQETDGSLDCGIEIISMPATLDYHLSRFPWAQIRDTVLRHGGTSHKAGTCGLHVHVSNTFFGPYRRERQLGRIKLAYLVERFWEELVIFSRRNQRQLETNANKYGCPLLDAPSAKKMQELHHNFARYQAVNVRPEETTEIRLWRGTLTLSSLFASLEMTDLLARTAKRKSKQELQTLSWADFLDIAYKRAYQYLYPYLRARGLLQAVLPETERLNPNFSEEV